MKQKTKILKSAKEISEFKNKGEIKSIEGLNNGKFLLTWEEN